MGNSINHIGKEHQQQAGYSSAVYPLPYALYHNVIQRACKMANLKALVWISNFLGYPLYGYVFFLFINTWKADLLFFIAMLHAVARLYFYIRKNSQSVTMTDLEIEEKEYEHEHETKKQR